MSPAAFCQSSSHFSPEREITLKIRARFHSEQCTHTSPLPRDCNQRCRAAHHDPQPDSVFTEYELYTDTRRRAGAAYGRSADDAEILTSTVDGA